MSTLLGNVPRHPEVKRLIQTCCLVSEWLPFRLDGSGRHEYENGYSLGQEVRSKVRRGRRRVEV